MTLEKDLADFICRHNTGKEHRLYRDQCMRFWIEHYGPVVAKKVEKEVGAEWKRKKLTGVPFYPLAFIV